MGRHLVKWDAKLGFVPNSTKGTLKSSLLVNRISDIIPGGGNVPCIKLIVSRRYPVLHLEKDDSDDTSRRSAVLTKAEEDSRRLDFEKRFSRAAERLSDSLQKEIEEVSIIVRPIVS